MATISKLKKELDRVFSIYIRMRGADHQGMAQCFTCGKKDHWKKLQCGHFQSRSKHSLRWDSETGNCQIQCVKCNMFNQGEQFKFGLYLDQKFGEGHAESLVARGNMIVKYNRTDYIEAIALYKQKIKELENGY